MGKRDYRWREPKKPKKGEKKAKPLSELMPQAEVELIKKQKKTGAEEAKE